MTKRPGRRTWAAALMALALAACGGGGGGGDSNTVTFSDPPAAPPTTVAAVGFTSADAIDLVKASVAAADGVVARQNALLSLGSLLGAPLATSPDSLALEPVLALAVRQSVRAAAADRVRILAVTTDPCTELVNAPCTGTITTDTNISDTATAVLAGQYVDVTFNSISGTLDGVAVSFAGRMRIEFLTGFNANSTSVAGLGLRIKLVGFSGSVAGNAFGPVSNTMDLSFNAQGVPTIVTGGIRFGIVQGVSITGAGAFSIASAAARVGYGSAATGYIDINIGSWYHSGGRPISGIASINAGSIIASVTVGNRTANTVTYSVFIADAAPGSGRSFTVTALYSGGGAPSYTAI